MDAEEKSATSATSLIVNDLAGNTIGNTAATGGNMRLLLKNLTTDFTDFTDGLTDHGKPG
jgi:hypothetical protein